MLNSTLSSVVVFFAVYYSGIFIQSYLPSLDFSTAVPSPEMSASHPSRTGCLLTPETVSMHILMAAYLAHLLARTIYLTLRCRRILKTPSQAR